MFERHVKRINPETQMEEWILPVRFVPRPESQSWLGIGLAMGHERPIPL